VTNSKGKVPKCLSYASRDATYKQRNQRFFFNCQVSTVQTADMTDKTETLSFLFFMVVEI